MMKIKNSVVKIQNLIVNHELRPVKSNSEQGLPSERLMEWI